MPAPKLPPDIELIANKWFFSIGQLLYKRSDIAVWYAAYSPPPCAASVVMNVLWIALLALLVLLEKFAPIGRWIARAAGGACIAAGAWMLLSSMQ
jgi:hypothetical protein